MKTAATAVEERLDATFGVWLMLYPYSWQQQHGEEARAILVDRALERGGRVGLADVADLIWHAFAARMDNAAEPLLGRLPRAGRAVPAIVALTIATVVSVIMIVGEVYGAAHRAAALPNSLPANAVFLSGPFLTIGVGVDVGFIVTLALFVSGFTRAARIGVLATTIFAIWISLPGDLASYPHPAQAYSGAVAVLGLIALAGLADGTAISSRRRALIGAVVAILSAAGVGLGRVITGRPGWSPVHSTGSVTVAVVLYVLSAAVLVITIGAALIPAIRHRRFGGILMIMIAATIVAGLRAVAATVDSDPQTAWIWPALCLAVTALVFSRLRRMTGGNAQAATNPPASGQATITD